MDVAVVIPLFNGAKWIRQTLESVFSQSQPPVEVVVVDDGSQDSSPEIVQAFSGVKLLYHPGKGANLARKFGLEHTTAPLVVLLDQDDIWHPDHLQLLSGILEQHCECPAAVANSCFFESDDSLVFPPPALDIVPFDPWSLFPFNPICSSSAVVIRRTALNTAGGWPTQFVGVADFYTWLMLSINKPLITNRSVTVGYRCHDSSYSTALRVQNFQKYYGSLVAASEDALTHRLADRPQDAGMLKKRRAILDAVSGILRATNNQDRILLAESAIAFEENMSGDSVEFIQAALDDLLWFLHPTLSLETPEQQTVFWWLLAHWPTKAANTRRLLLLWNTWVWTFLRHLSNRPFQLRRWILFADTVRERILRRLKR